MNWNYIQWVDHQHRHLLFVSSWVSWVSPESLDSPDESLDPVVAQSHSLLHPFSHCSRAGDEDDLPEEEDFSSLTSDNDPGVFSIIEDEQSDIHVKLELLDNAGEVCVAVLTEDKMASSESSASAIELFMVLNPEDNSPGLSPRRGLLFLVPSGRILVKKFCSSNGIFLSVWAFRFAGTAVVTSMSISFLQILFPSAVLLFDISIFPFVPNGEVLRKKSLIRTGEGILLGRLGGSCESEPLRWNSSARGLTLRRMASPFPCPSEPSEKCRLNVLGFLFKLPVLLLLSVLTDESELGDPEESWLLLSSFIVSIVNWLNSICMSFSKSAIKPSDHSLSSLNLSFVHICMLFNLL